MIFRFQAMYIFALVTVVGFSTRSNADDLAESTTSALVSLTASDQEVREAALKHIKDLKAETDRVLVEKLKAEFRDPDRHYHGPLHMALLAAGEWRVEDAVPILLGHIDLTLKLDTFPVGDRQPLSAFYPVAQTLVKIQGRTVTTQVLDLLGDRVSESKLRTGTWVLRESLGLETAKVLLDSAIQQAAEDAAKKQLAAARALLDDPVILRLPNR